MSTGVVKQPSSHFRDIPRDECEALLAAQRTGRVRERSRRPPGPPCYLWCLRNLAARCALPAWQPHKRRFRNRRHRSGPRSRWSVVARGIVAPHELVRLWTQPDVVPWAPGIRTCGLAFRSVRSADDRSRLRSSTNPRWMSLVIGIRCSLTWNSVAREAGILLLLPLCGLDRTLCSDWLGCARFG